MAVAAQTVEVRVPFSPTVDAGKLNATLGVFQKLAQRLAGQFSGVKLGGIDAGKLNSELKVTSNEAEKAARALQDLTDSGDFNKLTKGLEGANDKASGLTKTLGGGGGLSSVLKGAGFAAAAAGVGAIGKAMIDGNSEMENYNTQFEVMTGSMENGKKLMADLVTLGASTPFETSDLATSTTALLAFGSAQDQIIPQLKVLGDLSGGNAEKLQSLTRAFGKVQSNGKLTGEELGIMIDNGFNPLTSMVEKTGKSMAEMRKEVELGNVSFDDVNASMAQATSEGGQFFKMMEKSAGTYSGMMSTIQDALGGVVRTIGGPLFDQVKVILGDLTKVLGGPEVQQAAAVLGKAIGSIVGVLGGVFAKLLPIVVSVLVPLADTLSAIMVPISSLLDAILTPLAEVVKQIIGPLTSVLTLVSTLVTAVITPLTASLGVILPAMIAYLKPVLGIVGGIAVALTPVFEIVGRVFGLLAPLMQQLNPVVLMMQVLGPIWESLMPPILQLVDVIAQLVVTLLNALMPVLQLLLPMLTKLIGWLAGALGEGLGFVLGLVVQLVASIVTLVADGLTWLITALVDAVKWIMTAAEAIGDFLSPVLEAIGDMFVWFADVLGGMVMGVLRGIGDAFVWVAEFLIDLLTPAVDALSGALSSVIDWLSDAITTVGNAIVKFVQFTGVIDAGKAILGVFGKAIDFVKSTLANVGLAIKGAAAGFASLKATIKEVWDAITSFNLSAAFDAIVGGLFKAAGAAKESGKQINNAEDAVNKNAQTQAEKAKRLAAQAAGMVQQITTAGKAAIGSVNIAAKKTAAEVNAAMTPVVNEFRNMMNAAKDPRIKQTYAKLMGMAKGAALARIKELKAVTKPPPTPTDKKPKADTKTPKTALQLAVATAKANEETLKNQLSTTKTLAAQEREKKGLIETDLDKLVLERESLKNAEAQLAKVQELLKVQGQGADAEIKIDLKEGEANDARAFLLEALDAVSELQARVSDLTVKVLPEVDLSKIRDLERTRLELEIRLGLKSEVDLEAMLKDDVTILQQALTDLTTKRESELLAQREKGLFKAGEYEAALLRVQRGGEAEQLELKNNITNAEIELMESRRDREIQLLEERYAAEDLLRKADEQARDEFNANLIRASEQLGTNLVNSKVGKELEAIDRAHEASFVSDEVHAARRAELEKQAAAEISAVQSMARGQQLELDREQAVAEMELLRQRAEERKEAAITAGDIKGAQAIQSEIDDLTKGIQTRGNTLTSVAGDLQAGLTDIMGNLFTGDPEKIKEPFRQTFAILVGALQRMLSAKVLEVVLGSISGITGFPGMLLTLAAGPVISGLLNALLTPVTNLLLSFPTGHRFDSPTFGMIGDGSKLGGTNTEWLFRDDQLQMLLHGAVTAGQSQMVGYLQEMTGALWALVDTEIVARGTDLVRVTSQQQHVNRRRVINANIMTGNILTNL